MFAGACVNNGRLTLVPSLCNLQGMKKIRRAWKILIITVSVILLLAGAAAAVYFLAFDSLALVTDDAFMQVMPSGTLRGLRIYLAGNGIRLKVVKLQEKIFSSAEPFTSALSALKDDYIVLTPVPAAFVVNNMIDVSSLNPSSIVLGIHDSSAAQYFDCILVSGEMSGWEKAAASLMSETESMSQNIALVYEGKSKDLAQGIVACFPAGHVTEFRKEDNSRMFASGTISQMDNLGIVMAMCPYVSGFSGFFDSKGSSSVSWITDYRLAPAVTDGNLYGIVVPDFMSIAAIAAATEKGAHDTAVLGYVYEKR